MKILGLIQIKFYNLFKSFNSMSEKCLCCFPLECGIKTLAILTIVGTIILGINTHFIFNAWNVYWPMILCYLLMSNVWLIALFNTSKGTKKFAFYGWIVLVVLVARIYNTFIIWNGSLMEAMCHEEVIM